MASCPLLLSVGESRAKSSPARTSEQVSSQLSRSSMDADPLSTSPPPPLIGGKINKYWLFTLCPLFNLQCFLQVTQTWWKSKRNKPRTRTLSCVSLLLGVFLLLISLLPFVCRLVSVINIDFFYFFFPLVEFSNASAKFYCRIYYAAEFHRMREEIMESTEEDFIRSLSHCVNWQARGGKSGAVFYATEGKSCFECVRMLR